MTPRRNLSSDQFVLATMLLFALCLSLANQAIANAGTAFRFATTQGPLPKIAYPRHYVINLEPDITTRNIQGSETVNVDILQPTKSLYLNVRNMQVSSAELTSVSPCVPLAIHLDTSKEILTLTAKASLKPGPITIAVSFTGHIVDAPTGLYRVKYSSNGQTKYMLASQLESTDARRVFPCWDEPVYRATYQINATFPAGTAAYSNMPASTVATVGKWTTYHFEPTPPMASYLNALCAGDLQSTHRMIDGTDVEVVCTRGKLATANYALDVEGQCLPYYNSYFGQKFPLPKLDLVAVPGGFPGAMENWGCILFDEDFLLYDSAKVGIARKQEIYAFIAHETAHQWFGDLVTMAWWNDIWLNEGFASWMETKVPAKFNPDWNSWRDARAEEYRTMDEDSVPSTHPVVQPLSDPNQIEDAFDDITYIKGEAVIRMLESYLGEDTFRDGIRIYMAKHKYSNATSTDLWNALAKSSGKPIEEIASSWINQPGFPLVGASVSCSGTSQTLTLTQSRFYFDPAKSSNQTWQIPVTISDQTNPNRSINVVMSANTLSIPAGNCGDTIIVGHGATGYYRVQYDNSMLTSLEKTASSVSPDDRLSMLSDQWALVSSNKSHASDYLALVQALPSDRTYQEWRSIGGAFDAITTAERGDPDKPKFQSFVRSQFEPVFLRLGWTDKPSDSADDQKLRDLAVTQLGYAGDPQIIADAKTKFAAYVADPKSLDARELRQIAGIVGSNADQTTYDELHKLAKSTTDRSLRFTLYRAMFAAHAPELAEQNLQLAMSGEVQGFLAEEDAAIVAKTAQQPDLAWQFIKKNYVALSRNTDSFARMDFVPRFFKSFDDMKYAQMLQDFAKTNLPADAQPLVAKAVDSIKNNAQFKTEQIPSVDSWLASQQTNQHA